MTELAGAMRAALAILLGVDRVIPAQARKAAVSAGAVLLGVQRVILAAAGFIPAAIRPRVVQSGRVKVAAADGFAIPARAVLLGVRQIIPSASLDCAPSLLTIGSQPLGVGARIVGGAIGLRSHHRKRQQAGARHETHQ
ncbi:MAG: hypothetical protein ABIY70_12425 [Capsulimonas sp.]|uniref:hypothetical protein n=1 Tax=Capsulimonas sp. TaxID=2494211 RepID=UPI003263B398